MSVRLADLPSLSRLAQTAATLARERVLPVVGALEPLFPGRVLRRGTVVVVEVSTSLALATLAGPSAAGSWCAAVGMPSLGMLAAAAQGCDLSRFALVPDPGTRAAEVVAALVDELDVVLVGGDIVERTVDARRLVARVRERGSVLVVAGSWRDRSDIRLRVERSAWEGLGDGHGHLRARTLSVLSTGRGASSGERRAMVRL